MILTLKPEVLNHRPNLLESEFDLLMIWFAGPNRLIYTSPRPAPVYAAAMDRLLNSCWMNGVKTSHNSWVWDILLPLRLLYQKLTN